MMGQKWKGSLILALFFCSGAAALVYEVVWSKFLAQMLGSTVQAQTVVLAVFMGGLALGNRLMGRRADGLQRPLRAYGWVEIGVGLYAFFFSSFYQVADALFVAAGSRINEQPALLLALKGSLSVALLLGPTILMGSTLPLMAAWLQRSCDDPSRRSARFYSVNSLGAVCGAGLAGFWIVQTLGMVAALQAAALVNVLVGTVAILVGRDEIASETANSSSTASEKETEVITPDAAGEKIHQHATWIVAITGGVAMGLEVLSARSLSLIFGSSLQSFAIVLISFILGIGVGGSIVSSTRWRRCRAEQVLVALLTIAALWIGALLFKIESWVDWYRWARTGIAASSVGYLFHLTLTGVLAMALLGFPAGMLGSVLPMLMRVVPGEGRSLADRVGRLLTWNTVGAVAGVLLTGFVLMPHAGLRGAFEILALLLCGLAAWVGWRMRSHWHLALPSGVAALLLAGLAGGGEGWKHALSSGAFRARETEADFSVMERRKQHVKILFYEDAPDATVTVERGDGIGAADETGLRINGKPDASSHGDLSSQLLLTHLPLLARPGSKDVFLLGLGSGISGGAALRHDLTHLVIAENCEPVVRAAKWFEPWNGGVLTDPRASIRLEDARTVLKLSPQQYDIIITQPSNPWMVGVGSVFSREFYELAASRLRPGGIVAQWFHTYEMHDGIVSLVLRTFSSVYPYMEVWDSESGDIILLGAMQPWNGTLENFRKGLEREPVRRDLARIGIQSAEALLARQLASQRTGFAIADDGALQRDWFPLLEYEAPKAFHIGITSDLLAQYDERGTQWQLAPAEKTGALRGLKDSELKVLFGQFTTGNQRLKSYLRWRMGIAEGESQPEPNELRAFPCVFRPSGPAPTIPALAQSTNSEVRSISGVMDQLQRGDAAERHRALLEFEALLRSHPPAVSWSVGACSAQAARTAMADADWPRAWTILNLGLKEEPQNRQLQFLARIFAKEQPGAPVLSMNP